MLRQSIRSSQSIALGFALCLVAAGATGCGTSDTASSGDGERAVVPAGVRNVRVIAADIQALPTDAFYKVDLSGEKVVYHFDYSDAALDYDRIQLVSPKGEALLSSEMKMVQEGDYGDYPQPNLLGASDKRFSLAMNEADFGKLTPSQLNVLKTSGTGFFYSEAALEAPNAKAQSVDDGCIHAVCEFCFENGTSSPPISWQPGTYHCYYEEHVWCD